MLFDCPRINGIWKEISAIFNVNIKWKHVVWGFNEDNINGFTFNLIINIIAYSIYKQWIICKQELVNNYATKNIWKSCVNELAFYTYIYNHIKNVKILNVYKAHVQKLLLL